MPRARQRGDEVVGRSGRNGEQQAARRLRVAQQELLGLGQLAEVDLGCDERMVARVPPATMSAAISSRTPSMTGTASAATTAPTPDPTHSSRRCPSSPNPVTSVAACTPTSSAASRAPALSVVITSIAVARSAAVASPRFTAVEMHSESDRLGQHQRVAGFRGRVREHRVGVDGADHRQAVLRLRVVDRVAAGDEAAGRRGRRGPAVEHARQQLERQPFARPRHEVQREQRGAAHRVDVGERVRGRDPAPVVRVVDDRREEVGGDDDGEVVTEPVDRGVVGGVEPDEQVRVGARVHAPHQPEHGAQVGGRELAGAAGAVRERREPDGFGCGHRPIMPDDWLGRMLAQLRAGAADVVASERARDLHDVTGLRCVHVLAVADVHADVVDR